MQDLSVTLVRSELDREDTAADLARFEALVQRCAPDSDLIVLPEMLSTGFSMNAGRLNGGVLRDCRRRFPAWKDGDASALK